MCAFHMFGCWRIPGYQGVEAQTFDNGRSRRSLEKDLSYVFRLLYKHSPGECELAIYPGVFHADHKVIHPCNHRLYLTIWNKFIPWRLCLFSLSVICQWNYLTDEKMSSNSCSSVAYLEQILWLAYMDFFNTYSRRNSPHIHHRTQF